MKRCLFWKCLVSRNELSSEFESYTVSLNHKLGKCLCHRSSWCHTCVRLFFICPTYVLFIAIVILGSSFCMSWFLILWFLPSSLKHVFPPQLLSLLINPKFRHRQILPHQLRSSNSLKISDRQYNKYSSIGKTAQV